MAGQVRTSSDDDRSAVVKIGESVDNEGLDEL